MVTIHGPQQNCLISFAFRKRVAWGQIQGLLAAASLDINRTKWIHFYYLEIIGITWKDDGLLLSYWVVMLHIYWQVIFHLLLEGSGSHQAMGLCVTQVEYVLALWEKKCTDRKIMSSKSDTLNLKSSIDHLCGSWIPRTWVQILFCATYIV